MAETDVTAFEHAHLEQVLELLEAEGWDTYTEDPERTYRVLTAPGSTTLVSIEDGVVAGFVQIQSDGEIQAHLSGLLVGEPWRGRGISRTLLREGLSRAGGMRVDIISAAESFYSHIGAEAKLGWRLRPPDLAEDG
jgi:ribosomal protein S18 acetylase RimI-like enzyme